MVENVKFIGTTQQHLTLLMAWFDTQESCRQWGGPYFRFPYNIQSFKEDVAWQDVDSYSLLGPDDELLAFGQYYIKHDRIHLARLVVSPPWRGQGIGKKLLSALIAQAQQTLNLSECSLYVYKHNEAAVACYQACGFKICDYPRGEPFKDSCYFMVRSIDD